MESHLLQMRGLKPLGGVLTSEQRKSHLLQMRGLKQCFRCRAGRRLVVASFTDAWIETIGAGRRQKRAMSHLLQMRGLKPLSHFKDILKARRIFYRCVD